MSDLDAFESALASGSITITLNARPSSTADDLAHVQVTGICSALVTLEEANAAAIQGQDEEDGKISIKDEDLIAICIYRARQRCAEMAKLLAI